MYDELAAEADIVKAPFDLTKGVAYKNFTLTGTLPTTGDALVLDFTDLVEDQYSIDPNLGAYLSETNTDYDYLVVNFDGVNFAEWYAKTPATISGMFQNDVTAIGYVITEAYDGFTGDIVFFNKRVEPQVLAAEKTPGADTPAVPEPTTATLSLLALAGLAARRHRK